MVIGFHNSWLYVVKFFEVIVKYTLIDLSIMWYKYKPTCFSEDVYAPACV